MVSKKPTVPPEMPGQMELPLTAAGLSSRLEELRETNLVSLVELQGKIGVELDASAIHQLRLETFIDHVLGHENEQSEKRLTFEVAFEAAKGVVLARTLQVLNDLDNAVSDPTPTT